MFRPTRFVLAGGASTLLALVVACGGGGRPSTSGGPPPGRHWVATQESATLDGRPVEVKIVSFMEWPEDGITNRRLMFIMEVGGIDGAEVAKAWDQTSGPSLSDGTGHAYRRVTTAALVQIMRPKNGQCMLMFDGPDDGVDEVYLALPSADASSSERVVFRSSRSQWRNFGGPPASLPAPAPITQEPTAPIPSTKSVVPSLPTRTITPIGKQPVPVAMSPKYLEEYKDAALFGRKVEAEKLVKEGVVLLVEKPTVVRYEQTLKGLAYVRLPDGPLKDRLAVVDAAFVKE